jgi:hypothetical protein
MLVINRRAMNNLRRMCDQRDLPYPQELCAYLLDLHEYRRLQDVH